MHTGFFKINKTLAGIHHSSAGGPTIKDSRAEVVKQQDKGKTTIKMERLHVKRDVRKGKTMASEGRRLPTGSSGRQVKGEDC